MVRYCLHEKLMSNDHPVVLFVFVSVDDVDSLVFLSPA